MNNRIARHLEQLERRRSADNLAKRMADPGWAVWRDKADLVVDKCVDRLDTFAVVERWPASLRHAVDDVLTELCGIVIGHLGVHNKPEPVWTLRTLTIFPRWLSLVPMDLREPVMRDMLEEHPCPQPGVADHKRRSWFGEWLQALGEGGVVLPDGLTPHAMGVVVRTLLTHAEELNDMPAFCGVCGLPYPIRQNGRPLEILRACPHCGSPGKPDDGPSSWVWQTALTGNI